MGSEIILPKFGQQTETSTILRWYKKEGDRVEKGEALLEIQTDKAAMDVESFTTGTLLKIWAQPGEELPVMAVIGYIGEPGEAVPPRPPLPAAPAAAPAPPPTAAPTPPSQKIGPGRPQVPTSTAPAPAPQPAPPPSPVPSRFSISPRARKLAADALINPRRIAGSGPNGRVIERDVRAYLDAKGWQQISVTPLAKTLIKQHNLDVFDVAATTGATRIDKEHVMRALAEQPKPLSPMRKIIARRMTESTTTIPHFFVTVAVDMTDLLEYRKNARRESGLKASVGDFIMKACAIALRAMPIVNSVCLGDTVITRQRINIGMAVALDDGLIVPVVRDVDRLSLDQIAERTKDLTERARAGKLLPDEIQGGTFTISNMGMLGVDQFTAIINPGEGAILAVGAAVETPVVRQGQIVIRSIMKMTLSSDHRIIDGAVAAQFLKKLKDLLESTDTWQ